MAFTSRDELLEKVRLEREERRGEKTRNVSATIIQVCLCVLDIRSRDIERQHGSTCLLATSNVAIFSAEGNEKLDRTEERAFRVEVNI